MIWIYTWKLLKISLIYYKYIIYLFEFTGSRWFKPYLMGNSNWNAKYYELDLFWCVVPQNIWSVSFLASGLSFLSTLLLTSTSGKQIFLKHSEAYSPHCLNLRSQTHNSPHKLDLHFLMRNDPYFHVGYAPKIKSGASHKIKF